ncbi:hypothetical protein D3C86_2008720 [compost metagenome]
MNRRQVSAPYCSIMVCGSTPLFFDLDIFSMPPISTGRPSLFSLADSGLPLASISSSTSAGLNHSLAPLSCRR